MEPDRELVAAKKRLVAKEAKVKSEGRLKVVGSGKSEESRKAVAGEDSEEAGMVVAGVDLVATD